MFIDFYDEFKGFRSMVWDEENRLRGINDNGRLHLYTYDHTGERALKSSAESSMAVINGLASAVITHTEDYTAYVSPYFVVQKGKFTKHYFEGSSRIVSKLGEGTFSHKNTGIMAGGLDYLKRTQKEQEARDRYIKGLNVPPGPPTQHGIYASPEWTGKEYPSIDWEAISQNQEPPQGWPRYPRFNEPGDVPGPPVQFGPPITNNNVKAGYGFIPNGVEEKNLYYYHPDHLGSSSYITDREGQIIQHTEYMAFGEVLVDEHSTTNKMPYLFNGKELDYETGLYYYGARYYDPKTSLWLNTDPLSGYNPILETEHYIDGQHNGGIFNPMNMATYSYTYQNPVIYVDPNGKQSITATIGRVSPRFGNTIELSGHFTIPKSPIIPRIPILPNNVQPLYPKTANKPKLSRLNRFDWKSIDMGDVKTWPKPPVDGKLTPGDPSRDKPRQRGEKSLYDEKGGEWRPHKPDKYHPEGHWDYKPAGNNQSWENIFPSFVIPEDASIFEKIKIKYQEYRYKHKLESYQEDMKKYEEQMKEYFKQHGA